MFDLEVGFDVNLDTSTSTLGLRTDLIVTGITGGIVPASPTVRRRNHDPNIRVRLPVRLRLRIRVVLVIQVGIQ